MKIYRKILSLGLSLATVLSLSCINSNAQQSFVRYSGKDRVETCLKTSGLLPVNGVVSDGQKHRNIVIADAYSFADSLSAMNIANKYNAVLLLSPNRTFPDFLVKKTIRTYEPNNIFLVGGKVSNRYNIENFRTEGTNIVSISGKDRYETNRKSIKVAGYSDVGVASGENYADALSAYSLLSENNLGLLLVRPHENYDTAGLNVKYTFGGKNSVRKDGGVRIAGSSRYETSSNIANRTDANNIAFVSGNNFADALSSINLVKAKDADIVLTPHNGNTVIAGLSKNAGSIYAVGGVNTISDEAVRAAIEGKPLKKPVINKKPVQPVQKNYITVPNTKGKVKVYLPPKIASRLYFSKDGHSIIDREANKELKYEDRAMVFTLYTGKYVGTNAHHHIYAGFNTYGTYVDGNRKYSLYADSHTGFAMLGGYEEASDYTRRLIRESNEAVFNAVYNHHTSGIIH